MQFPCTIAFSETQAVPAGSDPHALFSGGLQSTQNAFTGVVMASISIDPSAIAGLLPSSGTPAAPVHLSAADLRAQYTDAELLAALQAPKS